VVRVRETAHIVRRETADITVGEYIIREDFEGTSEKDI